MAIQSSNGKAFEYAVSSAFYEVIQQQGMTVLNEDKSKPYQTAKFDYDSLVNETQDVMYKAAKASVDTILQFEPNLANGSEPITISIQEDGKGIVGDVSDVVLRKDSLNWQIGISCKHNHSALKHSRLSSTIDFGKDWLGYPCSTTYWEAVRPQFDVYKKMIAGLPRKDRPLWRDFAGTEGEKIRLVYLPILEAFKKELLQLDQNNPDVPRHLVQYLLGRKDFYKVISVDREKKTNIQAFNISDTLSANYKKNRPRHKATKLSGKLPTKIFDISFNDTKTTLIVAMDEGWAVSMRLHNASSKIEPSLKFDIQLTGTPSSLSTISSYWI